MKLYLDDVRDLPDESFLLARSYEQAVLFVKENGIPPFISFDHDLASIHYDPSTWTEGFEYSEKTGLDCAKYLIDYCRDRGLKLPEVKVHSMNPVGRENIKTDIMYGGLLLTKMLTVQLVQ